MHILVPVKNTAEAKSRLAGLLTPEKRRALTLALLRDVLTALTRSHAVSRSGAAIYVVSDDPLVKRIAHAFSVGIMEDSESGDLNAALTDAARCLGKRRAGALWVIPADLARITQSDIDVLFSKHQARPAVTLAPAAGDEGTNALGMSSSGLINFSFGRESFERHSAAARLTDATLNVIHRPGLAFDLDTVDDLKAFAEMGSTSCAGQLVADWAR